MAENDEPDQSPEEPEDEFVLYLEEDSKRCQINAIFDTPKANALTLDPKHLEEHFAECYPQYVLQENKVKQLLTNIKQNRKTSTNIGALKGIDITLRYDEESGVLTAHPVLASTTKDYNISTINSDIADIGLDDLLIQPKNIELLKKNIKNRIQDPITIATREDANVEIKVSVDKLSAHIRASRAYGGTPLSYLMIQEALLKAGITAIIDEQTITEELEQMYETDVLVAQGTESVAPIPAQFICKFSDPETHKPHIREDGTVDYRELNNLVIVEIGDPLLERIPPQPGHAGEDIYGNIIPPDEVESGEFIDELEGCEIDPNNENLLIATIKGHPVLEGNGVRVDKTLQYDNIDMSSGNIHFDGSLTVNGDITEGMHVDVTGDIFVNGQIYSATVKAKGNIIVSNGIVGKAEQLDHDLMIEDRTYTCHVSCEGQIVAKYLNYVSLQSKSDVIVSEYIFHSYLQTNTSCIVGEPAGKGILLGGLTIAKKSVIANIIGNTANSVTRLKVGITPDLKLNYSNLNEKLAQRDSELLKLSYILKEVTKQPVKKLGTIPIQKTKKIAQTFMALKHKRDEIKEEVDYLSELIEYSHESAVYVKGTLYPNTHVCLNAVTRIITEKIAKVAKLFNKDNRIVFVEGD